MLDPVIPDPCRDRAALQTLRARLEQSWSAETSFWPEHWSAGLPSLGQCAVTALVVHDRFGGEILRSVNEGVVHYWNRLDGREVDLTRDQFEVWTPDEAVAVVDAADVAVSGPTLAARHRMLAAALVQLEQGDDALTDLPPPPASADAPAGASSNWFRTLAILIAFFSLLLGAVVLSGWILIFRSQCAFPWGTERGCAFEVGFTALDGVDIRHAQKASWLDTNVAFELHGSPASVDAALAEAGFVHLHPVDQHRGPTPSFEVDMAQVTDVEMQTDHWVNPDGRSVDREVVRATAIGDPTHAVVYVSSSY